jgi:hypothetical protein
MLRKLSERLSYSNVMSTIAVFGVLAGGTAYAANTINSTDIVDGQVKSVDVGDGEVKSADVKDESLTTFDVSTFLGADVVDGTLTGDDVADTSSLGPQDIHEEALSFNNTLLASDLADDSVGTDEVEDNSLTGADINESTLSLPNSYPPASFVAASDVALNDAGQLTQVVTKTLPPGAYTVSATANFKGVSFNGGGPAVRDAYCELRSGGSYAGGRARDRRPVPVNDYVQRSLSMLGTVFVPANSSGDATLLCGTITTDEFIDDAQMTITRVSNFF